MNFQKLTDYLDQLHTKLIPARDMMIYKDHELVYHHFSGHSDAEGKTPMTGEETYCLYSCTKIVTTCAAMQLIEAGKLFLDDPVAEYLPAYAHLTVKDGEGVRPAKRTMTIRHLMSMQSGMNYNIKSPEILEELALHPQATTRQLAEAMAKTPLEFEPGTDFLYSLSHDVLAAVIEVASGQKFSDYLKTHIFEPLALPTISFEPTPAIQAHLCAKFLYEEQEQALRCISPLLKEYRLSPVYESGGAGLYSNMRDYALFLDAIACDGVGYNGARILSPEMIQLWRANQLGPVSRKSYETEARQGYSYGLGVRTKLDMSKGVKTSLCEFGWGGAAGAHLLIDTENHLSFFYAQHVRSHPYLANEVHPTLRKLAYEGMGL